MKIVLAVLLVCSVTATFGQFLQQGSKLVGTGAVGDTVWQGYSVALSLDGNTAVVGGRFDNRGTGCVWVYTRVGNIWSQQGTKLVGTGATGNAQQGAGVAMSADGNTIIVGGPGDNIGAGAAWVFTRVGSTWSQQGIKLVGTGATGNAFQGYQVALSADGNTAMIGGYQDNVNAGAAWVFTRVGNTWTQQGSKLVGTGTVGNAQQAVSVALSAGGNTAIIGGWYDNIQAGAAWVFTRVGNTWTQQGEKLVGTGAIGNAHQGYSVNLSDDGNTAIVGGYSDNANAGAVWIFTRVGSTWTQQGQKLVGSGYVGSARQGIAAALSGDGNTAIVGGYSDNINAGASWVFSRIGSEWFQQGSKLFGTGAIGNAQQGSSVALSSTGNTALIGGWVDNLSAGAVWVFQRNSPGSNFKLTRNNINKSILDNQSLFDTISILTNASGLSKTTLVPAYIQDVNVGIDTIIHSNAGDLEISLLHGGITDTVIYRAGGSGSNFINTVLDDSASTLVDVSSAPFTGHYIPTSPLTKFNGLDAAGTWILEVFDRAIGNTGTLQAWSLNLSTVPTVTSVPPTSHELPQGFQLAQNYPNPFNPSTKIAFQITGSHNTTLRVYDIFGRETATLVNGMVNAGNYETTFDAKAFASGVYYYRLQSGAFVDTKKMILIK
jgi:subtilisin-like proprotein convertase family protein